MARPPGEPPEAAGGDGPSKQAAAAALYDDDLTAPVKEVQEKWKLLPHFLQLRGLMRQHIDSFNYFVNREIKDIVNASSNREVSGRQQAAGSKQQGACLEIDSIAMLPFAPTTRINHPVDPPI
jgi:DNA-directed RNA polymerase beta subunit